MKHEIKELAHIIEDGQVAKNASPVLRLVENRKEIYLLEKEHHCCDIATD